MYSDTQYFNPSGRRLLRVQQGYNTLLYRIVTIAKEDADLPYTSRFSNYTRFGAFCTKEAAQAALDDFAAREGLLTYKR